jgi:hypothetical protein
LSEKPTIPNSPTDRNDLKTLGKGYVERVFKDIPKEKRHQEVGIEFQGNGLLDPYYHMSNGQLKTLQKGLNEEELFGLKASLDQATKLNKNTPLSLNGVSLDKVITEIADVQGKLLAFELQHGVASLFSKPKSRQEYAVLVAKMQALYNIAEQTALKVNAIHSPENLMKKQRTHLNAMKGEGFAQNAFLSRLRDVDKGRDLMVAGLRNFFAKKSQGKLEDALVQSFHTTKATKAFITLGSFVWIMGWMWYLSHAIQKGHDYPANRLVMLNKPKEETKAKSSSLPKDAIPMTKKETIRQRLSLYHPQVVEGGKAS